VENGTQNTRGVPSSISRTNAVPTSFDIASPPPSQPTPTPVIPPQPPPITPAPQPPSPHPKRNFKLGKIVLIVLAIAVLAGGGFLLFRLMNPSPDSVNSQRTEDAGTAFDTLDIPLDEVALASQILTTRTLNVNGQLKVDRSLILAPSTRPTSGIAGQMYYDSSTNQLNYYNGTGFVELGTNPQTVTSIGGASGTLTLGGGLSLAGGVLSNTGIVSITSASTNLTVTNDGGNVTIANTPGAPQGVQTVGGTSGQIALFNGAQTIGDSLLRQAADTVTADANFQVNGAIELQAAGTVTLRLTDTVSGVIGQIYNDGNLHVNGGQNNLWLDAGGSGTIFMNAANGNKVAINQSIDPLYPLEVNGDINISDAGGSLRIGGTAICTITGCVTSGGGGGGVTSLNGIDGALTLSNATAVGTTITIDDASTVAKGIASFNSTNFSVTAGAVNTIQNINTTAAPTFGQLTLASSQAAAAMLTVNNTNVGATGRLLDLQLNGTSEFSVSPAGNLALNGTVNGQTISSSANFTGTLGVTGNINTGASLFANAIGVTTNVNVSGTTSTNALSVTANAGVGGNLTVTGTTSTNTITPTAALTVGSTSQSFTLQGSATSTITATGGGFTTTVGFSGTPVAAVAYNFDRAAAAGTYLICTTAGNCAGVGGGVTTPGGTTNRLAKFTGAQAIGNSTLSDDGTNVITSADLIVQGGDATIGVANSQTGSLNFALSSSAFIGTISQSGLTASRTYLLPDASGTICLSSGNCSGSGSSNTLQASYDAGNTIATTNARNLLFTMSDLATDPNFLVNLECDTSCSTNGRFAIQDDGTDVFSVSPATGAAMFQNSTNTAAAFQVKTAAGLNSFLVDNANGAFLFGEDNVGKHVNIDLSSANGIVDIGASGGNLHFTLTQQSNSAAKINTDSDLIIQRDTNSTTAFQVQNAAGSTSVLTIDTANVLTRISGAGSDSSLVSGTGAIQIGADNGANMSFDDNEIIARNNGGTSTLFLQNGGGGLNVGANSSVFQVASNGDSLTVLNSSGNRIVNVDTAEGELELGTGSTINGTVLFRNSTNGFVAILRAPSSTANRTIALPDETGTICLQNSTSCGFALSGGSASYIQNQSAAAQTTSSFWTSGAGRSDTSFLAPAVDTGTAVALAIGGTTAASVNIGRAAITTNVVGAFAQSTGTFSLTGNNTSTISTTTNALTLTSASTATWSTTSGSLTLQSTNSSNNIVINGSSNTMTLNTGSTGTLTLGSANTSTTHLGAPTNNARTVNVGVGTGGSQTQTVNVGSLGGASATAIQAGTGNLALSSNGSITAKSVTNGANAVQVLNASDAELLGVDTTDSILRVLANNTGHIPNFTSDSDVISAREGLGMVSVNGYAYILGGCNSVGASTATAQYSRINADGSVGAWTTTTSFPTANCNAAVTTYNGYIYVNGGTNSAGTSDDIYYAKPNADGTITAWATASTALTTDLRHHQAVARGGYIYFIGGEKIDGTDNQNIYYAKLNADGSVGAFSTVTTWLPAVKLNNVSVAANGYLYVMGGSGSAGGTGSTTVYYGKFRSDGSVGTGAGAIGAASTTSTLPLGRTAGAGGIMNGYMYYLGGASANVEADTVYYAPINNDGTVGTWVTDSTVLPQVLSSPGVGVLNGYIYAIGGWNNVDEQATVYYSGGTRLKVGASLDLVGFNGENMNEGGSSSGLTAGNSNIIGTLNVSGAANFGESLSVGNNLSVTGETNTGTFSGAGLTDCDASNSKLLWDSTSKQFSCGTDRASVTIRKSVDESVTSSAALQNDDSFSFSVGAGETWAFQIYADVSSTAAGDFKSNLTAPAGSTCRYSVNNLYNVQNYTTGLCNDSGTTPHSDSFDNEYLIYGSVVTAGTAGTVQWQWAQGTSDATPTIVRAGSYLVAYKISGADIAEAYYTNDSSIKPGDVVSLDPTSAAGALKSTTSYDTKAIGVISTQPGQVLADPDAGNAVGRPVLVALNGRIPVKVTNDNGAIHAGDFLTTSTIPGVAMKATRPGQVIGRALADYDGPGQGVVLMFASQQWADPRDPDGQQLQSDLLQSANITNLTAASATIDSLTVTNNATFLGDVVVHGSVSVATLTVNGHIITGGDTPTASAAACSGATTEISGTDTAGTISVTTSGGCSGELAKITFAKAFGATPHVSLTPANAATAVTQAYVDSDNTSATSFTIATPTTINGSTTYRWYYQVLQ
jgi:hypothetical protein